MSNCRVAALLLLLPALLNGCRPKPGEQPVPESAAIDAAAFQSMTREQVQGLALAVIDAGAVRYVAAYGTRNAERRLPLTTETVMYGASLTKAAFAYMLLQLVDEGRLNLDAPLPTLLPRPLPTYADYADLAGDDRWRKLTPRILLNHTSGFANFRWLEPDKRLRLHHDPGTRYGYSGEGFYILQLIIEEGLHLDTRKEMQARVFDRFGMARTSMQWRPDFRENLADGYGLDGAMEPHDERSRASAAGSMDTTIYDQARLWAGIVRGDGLSAASRAELVRPQVPIASAHQFPTLSSETAATNSAINLAAGLGVITFRSTGGPAWFKGGHNDWTGNMVICQERQRRCLVMLANDSRAERIFPELAQMVLGEIGMPWHWEYGWLATRASAHPTFALPSPTGRFAIGTTSWRLTDNARREAFGNSKAFRQVEVVAWYPAAKPDGSTAPYLREGFAEVRTFAKLLRGTETVFDGLADVRTHAYLNAEPATPQGTKFPVLVFSPGYTSIPSAYTALLEDLASHGYVVLSVVHPFEVTAARLTDGSVVTLFDQSGALHPKIRDVFAEWAVEDKTMAAVTAAASDEARLRLLRGYFAGLRNTNLVVRRWTDDTRLVLDRLTNLPATDLPGRLAAILNTDRIGVFGHSMGGVVAGQFCVEDQRCAAGLNLDGIPQSGTMIDRSFRRPFLMVYSARPGRMGASDVIYRRASAPYYRVDVRDTLHLDFSDMVFWGGPLRERNIMGKLDPSRAITVTRDIVREYFDQELLGRSSPLLSGKTSRPEVTVHR